MRDKKWSSDDLMKHMDKDANGKVTLEEFDSFCTREGLFEGISQEDIARLYLYLDANQDG